MHFLMFRIKRAHLSVLWAAREFCTEVELTPARFDMLRAVGPIPHGTHQKELWRLLGLSRITISKMVRRLIQLGLLTRVRSHQDRRTFRVALTAEGFARMRRAYARIYKEQPFQRRFETAFGARSDSTASAVQRLTKALVRTAKHHGDTSCDGFYRSKDPDCR